MVVRRFDHRRSQANLIGKTAEPCQKHERRGHAPIDFEVVLGQLDRAVPS